MHSWPLVIPWCMELSNWSTLPWGYLHGRCLYGIFLIELVESELLCSFASSHGWNSYFRGCNWIPGLSSASSFDSDCSLDHSHRGFLLAWIWDGLLCRGQYPFLPASHWTVRYNFGPISISNIQLMILGVSIFLMVALQFIIQRQRWGKPCGLYLSIVMPLNWWGLT